MHHTHAVHTTALPSTGRAPMTPNPLRSSALAPPSPAHAAAYGSPPPISSRDRRRVGGGDAWAPPRRRPLRAVIATAWPRQWIKNGLVVAAPGAAGALGRDDVPVRVTVACLAFCLLSSGIYAINDVRDVHEDRRHPRKRFRPVAAGELPRRRRSTRRWLDAHRPRPCVAIRPCSGWSASPTCDDPQLHARVAPCRLTDLLAIAGGFVLRRRPAARPRRSALALVPARGERRGGLRRRRQALRRAAAHLARRRARPAAGPAPLHRALLRLLLAGSAAVAMSLTALWAFGARRRLPWRLVTILPFAPCAFPATACSSARRRRSARGSAALRPRSCSRRGTAGPLRLSVYAGA